MWLFGRDRAGVVWPVHWADPVRAGATIGSRLSLASSAIETALISGGAIHFPPEAYASAWQASSSRWKKALRRAAQTGKSLARLEQSARACSIRSSRNNLRRMYEFARCSFR